jgi:hypothetical protein
MLVWAALGALAMGGATGCAKPAAQPQKSVEERAQPEATGEAAKTQELEDKAAGYRDRYQEIQDSDMTAEEKAQAAGDLVDEQQRTVREAEDGGGGDESQR